MTVKIKLTKPYEQCRDLQQLVRRFGLTILPLFPVENEKTRLYRRIDLSSTESRRAVQECEDVWEFIIDRENSVPV